MVSGSKVDVYYTLGVKSKKCSVLFIITGKKWRKNWNYYAKPADFDKIELKIPKFFTFTSKFWKFNTKFFIVVLFGIEKRKWASLQIFFWAFKIEY